MNLRHYVRLDSDSFDLLICNEYTEKPVACYLGKDSKGHHVFGSFLQNIFGKPWPAREDCEKTGSKELPFTFTRKTISAAMADILTYWRRSNDLE